MFTSEPSTLWRCLVHLNAELSRGGLRSLLKLGRMAASKEPSSILAFLAIRLLPCEPVYCSMPSPLKILSSKPIYRGRVVGLTLDQVVEPGGLEAYREVVHHSASVVLLPRLPDGRVVLVRQYRYATKKSLWELVAGGIEPGEDPIRAARRELREETGFRARSVRLLLSFYPSPGFLTERMHLVQASGLTAARAQPEADERIEAGQFTLEELGRMVRANKIEDAKTLVGLLWLLNSTNARAMAR